MFAPVDAALPREIIFSGFTLGGILHEIEVSPRVTGTVLPGCCFVSPNIRAGGS